MKYILTTVICCLTLFGQAQIWSTADTTVLVCDAPITFELATDIQKADDVKFRWSNGATTPSIRISESGLYWVEVSVKRKTQRDSINVTIVPSPRDLLQDTAYICTENHRDEITVFTALYGTEGEFIWSDTAFHDASFTPTAPGKYTVTARNECGTFYDEIVVLEDSCKCSLFFANAFAFGCGDSYSDLYIPYATCDYENYFDYHMRVYNRWGELIWESFDLHDGWDATYQKNNQMVPVGTYVHYSTYKTFHNGKQVFRTNIGQVTFLR